MKLLDGQELADFIKERQVKQVRGLRQAHGLAPKLVVAPGQDDFVQLCQIYGQDILVDVDASGIDQPLNLELAKSVAVNWLLAGYNVNLAGKTILLAGQGSSLDSLRETWDAAGCQIIEEDTDNEADVLIANGIPEELAASSDVVGIDTAGESFAELVVCALFEGVIQRSYASISG